MEPGELRVSGCAVYKALVLYLEIGTYQDTDGTSMFNHNIPSCGLLMISSLLQRSLIYSYDSDVNNGREDGVSIKQN